VKSANNRDLGLLLLLLLSRSALCLLLAICLRLLRTSLGLSLLLNLRTLLSHNLLLLILGARSLLRLHGIDFLRRSVLKLLVIRGAWVGFGVLLVELLLRGEGHWLLGRVCSVLSLVGVR